MALHALSLCAPPGQSVSQPKHPDSKQCHILEILRRSSPPAGPQVSWVIKRDLGGCWTSPGDPGTHPGSPPGAGGVRVGECEIVVWVKWPLIVSGISGEVGPRWRTHGNPRHRTLCLDRHRQQLLFSQKIDIFFSTMDFFLLTNETLVALYLLSSPPSPCFCQLSLIRTFSLYLYIFFGNFHCEKNLFSQFYGKFL